MKYYNYVIFTPLIITLSTMVFKSKNNKNISEFKEITKYTKLPLITNLQHNEYQNNNSSFFKLIIWMLTYLFIYNHFPDSLLKNILFSCVLAHYFIFNGDFHSDKKLIFNFSIHMVFTLFLLVLILLFKYNYHHIFPLQILTLFLNIYIMYKDKINNRNLSNSFAYLQWLNYGIEFFPYN